MEWGFGAPSSFADNTGEAKPAAPASTYFDHGFGTPTLDQLVAATATFTFTDKPNEGSKITLTDSDGTAIVFVIDDSVPSNTSGSEVAVDQIGENGGGVVGTALGLAAAINGQSTLGISASVPSNGKIVLTQDVKGLVGNKTISVNDASHWNGKTSVNVPSGFTGGTGNSVTAVSLTTDTFDTGYGSPYNTPYELIAEVHKPDTGRFKLNGISAPFPDNGGIAVFLKGEIPYTVANIPDPNNKDITLLVVAPIKIRIFGSNNTFYDLQGKAVVSESNAPFVNGTEPGAGTDLEPLFRVRGNPSLAQAVRFVLPPLPPGTYGIKVYSGVTGGVVSQLAQAFRIVRRNRANSAYRMRSNVPELFKVGPRAVDGEDFWAGGIS